MKKTFRLKDGHPDMIRLDAAFEMLEKAGVSFEFGDFRTLVTIGENKYELWEVEKRYIPPRDIPMLLDYKLTFEREVDAKATAPNAPKEG